MGKPTAKKKDQVGENPGDANTKPGKHSDRKSKAFDEDMTIFINMSQEIREEGNKLFQKRDHEGAMLKYEKALKLLPKNHIDIANLRSNMAACYMQLGLSEYPRAINECNLALEVYPRYSKALIKRARCYEGLNRFDLAFRDVNTVLSVEPNNLSASEMFERVKKSLTEKGVNVDEKEIYLASVEPLPVTRLQRVVKEKLKKKNSKKNEEKTEDKVVVEDKVNLVKDKEVTKLNLVKDKEVTKLNLVKDKEVTKVAVEQEKLVMKPVTGEKVISKTVKLVFGEDIRWAQLPEDCSMKLVRDIVCDRFPGLKGVLVKYKDQEGDLVTITTVEELRLAEASSDKHGSLKLYIAEVGPDREPVYEGSVDEQQLKKDSKKPSTIVENGDVGNRGDAVKQLTSVESWIVQFAQLFKNHVGIESDSYLDLHEVGMKLYSEAMDDTITNDDAQELFEIAADQFQEMAALALFNWGNVHMSRARKQVFSSEDISRESLFLHIKNEYEWAEKEYKKAEIRYEEALKIKPDFYEGFLALGQQQFEHAKLCWYYAIATNTDLAAGASSKVLNHYNRAEDSMEQGIQIWEESEEQRLNGLSRADKYKSQLEKINFSGFLKDVSADEVTEQAASIKSQIYLLWGTLLYERSIVEYKLSLPTWEECLEVAVEKFELAGASPTDIAVMIKNHCSNDTALDGLGFKIDEIVQAWNEMYDAKRWQCGVPCFRLEPLFRRRVPKLQYILEHI